jgi:hypothetical protein
MRCIALSAVVLTLGLSACVVPPSASQRLAESAYDLNTAARFGRMDIALEHVREAAREEFSKKHQSWGKGIRIVDCDFGGVSIRKDGEADVTITVSWQRPNESTLRATDVSQRWSDTRGTWWMLREEETGGDPGLLAELSRTRSAATEAVPAGAPEPGAAPPTTRGRYQTKVIYDQ